MDENDIDLDALGDLDEEAILKLVDSAPEAEKIDSQGVKRLIVNFEKSFTENTKMRAKHADDAQQFFESEIELDRNLKAMQAIATAPEHYIELLRNGTHDSILNLLSHDNSDIAIGAIDLLRDFLATDESETVGIDDEGLDEDDIALQKEVITQTIRVFTTQLLSLGLLPMLESCMSRFKEDIPEEKQGVYDTLELLESLLEIVPSDTAQLIVENTKIIKWLLDRISSDKFGVFDDVKLYSSEILCIMAQTTPLVQVHIGTINGIVTMLEILSKYRKDDPKVAEEEEMVENICNTLCVACTPAENRASFLKSEGLDLIRLLIKSKRYVQRGAAKVLSFIITNDVQASSQWLDIGGLGTLFTAFMHQSKANSKNDDKKKKRKKHSVLDDEEHIVSTLAALLTNFKDAVQDTQRKIEEIVGAGSDIEKMQPLVADVDRYSGYIERIVVKFAETNCEKLERLVALHAKYFERMRIIDEKLRTEDDEDVARDDLDEDNIYEDRLEAGLFTLQLLDYILVFVSNSMPALKERATKYLQANNGNWSDVKGVLLEYAVRAASENEEDPDNATGETAYIRGLAESVEL